MYKALMCNKTNEEAYKLKARIKIKLQKKKKNVMTIL